MTTATDDQLLTLEAKRDALYAALEDGYDRLMRALDEHAMTDTALMEDAWIALLREYEAVCQELVAAL